MSEAPEATQNLEYYLVEYVKAIHIPHAVSRLHSAANSQKICSPCHSKWNTVTLHQLQTTEEPQKIQSILPNLFFRYHHP